jgi:hypothetical protein
MDDESRGIRPGRKRILKKMGGGGYLTHPQNPTAFVIGAATIILLPLLLFFR